MDMERNLENKFYCIKDNLKIINIMDLEYNFIIMVINIKVNIKIIKETANVNF